ncbi:MAG: metallophosphoesterase [Candidatus Lambdaproteobacteria bacterium]|nr:metallophosphoesterase [Candidatus Lambdaproteobacteria bacterium]
MSAPAALALLGWAGLAALATFAALAGYVYAFQRRHGPRLTPRGALRQTLPAPPEGLRFFVLSDTGTGADAQYTVAALMERRARRRPVDALLLLGDNFYMQGVSGVGDAQWLAKIIAPYSQGSLAPVPIFPVFGNHDYKGNLQAQLDFGLHSSKWRLPHRFYARTFGGLLKLIAFDSNFTDLRFDPDRGAFDFLLRELENREGARWVAVMAHHPVRSASRKGSRYSGGAYGWLLRPFLCGKAHVYLSGHAHHLEHRRVGACPTHFFISGGGGDETHPVHPDPEALYLHAGHGFLELEVTPQALVARFIEESGAEAYVARIERTAFPGGDPDRGSPPP